MSENLTMQVAQIRENEPGSDVEVLFWQSPQVFVLSRKNNLYNQILRKLRAAIETGDQVNVTITEPHGKVINNVQ